MMDRKLKKLLLDQGYEITIGGNNHYRIMKDGVRIGTVSSTASDYRTKKNELAYLRKAGVIIPRKGEKASQSKADDVD